MDFTNFGGGGSGTVTLPSAKKFPWLHRAISQVLGGMQDRKILLIGDSVTAGSFSTAPVLVGQGTSAAMAKVLAIAGVPAAEGLSIPQFNASAGADPRWSLGAGWAYDGSLSAHQGWGGYNAAFSASAGASPLVFTPVAKPFTIPANYDSADIYYSNPGALGGFSVNFNGGGNTVISGSTAGIFKTTVTGAAVATPAINMLTVTGFGATILGVECYLSTQPTLRIANAGVTGATAASWIDNTTPALSPLACLLAYAPDVALIGLGVNDMNTGPVSTFLANMASLATACQALPNPCDVVVWSEEPGNPTSGAVTQYAALSSVGWANLAALATAKGWGYIDLFDSWGGAAGFAQMNTDGYYADGVIHCSSTGLNDQGRNLATGLLAL
jgi:lysophospholipase L1-like esterase